MTSRVREATGCEEGLGVNSKSEEGERRRAEVGRGVGGLPEMPAAQRGVGCRMTNRATRAQRG